MRPHKSSPLLTRSFSPARRQLICGAGAAALLGLAACRPPQTAPPASLPTRARLRLIGETRLPHRLQFQGSTVGGLSGIDYDAASGLYYLISDDGSSLNPARFYTARMALDAQQLGEVTLLSVTPLRQADGSTYPAALRGQQVPDPEAIRWRAASQTLLWTSEGHVLTGAAPALREIRTDGTLLRDFALPAMLGFHPLTGARSNLTLEGLAITPDGGTVWLAMENALRQDGPVPSVQAPGGPCRFTQLDLASGQVLRQIAYLPDAIPHAPALPAKQADNGVSEILMLDAHRMLVLERAYIAGAGPGAGNSLRLYLIDARQGSDTQHLPVLRPGSYQPVTKSLLADFSAFTGASREGAAAEPRLGRLENSEGMSWGPLLANGNRSLVFVSDDNFNPRQATQFIAFEFFD